MTGIAQAHAIAKASKEAMESFDVMMVAAQIVETADRISKEELVELLFKYSGTLTASVASNVTHVIMSESDFHAMVEDVEMFQQIERDVLGE